jgi:sugar phosphate isomerase/epimerase
VIAEVGAWSNPLAPDEKTAAAALAHCKRCLALADRVGARCCVNISGSRGQQWDGPDPRNLTEDTFDRIVQCVREIIDEVAPTRADYTLETMPWMYPDSTESYARLLEAVGRERFGVHFDPVNLICSPQRYYGSGEVIREFVAKLGPRIRSCHAKDILLQTRLTTHLDEVAPGHGGLDYRAYLGELSRLESDTPLIIEHLGTEEEYDRAAGAIRTIALETGVQFR